MGKLWHLCADHPTYGGLHRPDRDCARCLAVYVEKHDGESPAPRSDRAERRVSQAMRLTDAARALFERRDELARSIAEGRKSLAILEHEHEQIAAEVDELRALFGTAEAKKAVTWNDPPKRYDGNGLEVAWTPGRHARSLSSDLLGSSLGGNHRE